MNNFIYRTVKTEKVNNNQVYLLFKLININLAKIKLYNMKKAIATLSMSILLLSSVFSQDDFKSFVLGLKFAPSIDWMQPNSLNYKSDGVVLGYTYGLIGDFAIGGSGHYFLNVGLQFKNTGGKLTYDDKVDYDGSGLNNATVYRRYNLNYVSIPLTFKLKTAQFGRMTYYGNFGIDNSIRTKARANDTYKLANSSEVSPKEFKINKEVSLFKESIIIGGGAEYTISGNTKAFAGIIFYNGFTDVLSGSNTKFPTVKENAVNKSLELVIGISF